MTFGLSHLKCNYRGTLAKTEIIYPKNVRAKVAMDFTYSEVSIKRPVLLNDLV